MSTTRSIDRTPPEIWNETFTYLFHLPKPATVFRLDHWESWQAPSLRVDGVDEPAARRIEIGQREGSKQMEECDSQYLAQIGQSILAR